MEKTKKIIVNVALILFLLFLVGTFLPMNIILFISVLILLVTFNVGLAKPIKSSTKIIIFLVFSLISIVYIAAPKKITGCGFIGGGAKACSSIKCMGIPYYKGMFPPYPDCIGKQWRFPSE